MGAFVNTLRHIQSETSGHVTGIHHQPHDAPRLRGHGALLGAVDLTCEVARSEGVRVTTIRKSNDGEEGQTFHFRLESVVIHEDEDGQTTAPLGVPANATPPDRRAEAKVKAKKKLPASAVIALNALTDAILASGVVPPTSNYIPDGVKAVTIDQWRTYAYWRAISDSKEERARQAAFKRAKDALAAGKFIGIWEPWVWIA